MCVALQELFEAQKSAEHSNAVTVNFTGNVISEPTAAVQQDAPLAADTADAVSV